MRGRSSRIVAHSRSLREKGIAVAITAATLTFIVPAVGLAIDAGMIYGVRARLSAAADAGALAAARSLSSGLTIAEQESSAIDTAHRFFNANFPNGYFYSTNKTVNVTVAETGTRTRTVALDVAVDAPSYFLRYLRTEATHVRAMGRASRRDINVMLVLDRSGSLANSSACAPMKNAAAAFVKKFANYRDRVGLLTYGGDYRIDFPMQTTPGNFLSGSGSIPALINNINCVGGTNSAQALWNAYGELKRTGEPGSLNVILFFTDGQPNALTFDFSAANALRTVARGYTGSAPTSASASRITVNSRTPCSTTTNKRGWITSDAGTGRAMGIWSHLAPAIPVTASTPTLPSADRSGCVFNMSSGSTYVYGDIGFMPPADIYGNSITGHKTLSLITNSSSPDFNKPRMDDATTMNNAGINAATHAARRIRTNETSATPLNTIIYSIGLGGVGAAEDDFLNRVSNTRSSPDFATDQPEGLYVYAPVASDLNQAFARIAGEILRIAR